MNSSLDKTYHRFLLGVASEKEMCRVEEAVLTGELDALSLQDAEDELIDDYLLGNIAQEERREFEQQFLTTEERRQRLKFASVLIEYSQKVPFEDKSVSRKIVPRGGFRVMFSWKSAAFLTATASVLLAVLAGVGLAKLRQQTQVAQEARNELTRLQASLAANNQAYQVAEPSTGILGDSEDAAHRMPSIEFASATRAVYPVIFRVPAEARFVRIDWKLATPFAEKYREVLLSESGQELWTQEFPAVVLSPAKRSTIVLPTSILVPGIYHLRIDKESNRRQFEELADFVFRVVRE